MFFRLVISDFSFYGRHPSTLVYWLRDIFFSRYSLDSKSVNA